MSFETDIQEWSGAMQKRVLEDVKALCIRTHEAIVVKTPIDTGRAMTSWNIAPGSEPDYDVTPGLATRNAGDERFTFDEVAKGASTLSSFQAMTASMAKHQIAATLTFPVVTISNSLHYIKSLEGGSSPQSRPAGTMFLNNVNAALVNARKMGYTAVLDGGSNNPF